MITPPQVNILSRTLESRPPPFAVHHGDDFLYNTILPTFLFNYYCIHSNHVKLLQSGILRHKLWVSNKLYPYIILSCVRPYSNSSTCAEKNTTRNQAWGEQKNDHHVLPITVCFIDGIRHLESLKFIDGRLMRKPSE